ncbi:PDR/VanB family oxidoreductase [Georgenia sp. AZ-5]|uniref:PDR/VanB family oxidoreductase n=1 Tax=Georgenia sp. AZ-5 TaxID=3367526 RepID=UPI0037546E92
MTLRVQAVRLEAENILSLELAHPNGEPLPAFTAGAHIDLALPNGLSRSYSLCNDPTETSRYVVAVARDAQSRGGSTWIHDEIRPGQLLEVTGPLNNFELVESAATSVLIAGGIGITPMMAMVCRLAALGRDWVLHYAVRTRTQAAFLPELERLAGEHPERLRLHVDDENGGAVLDLNSVVQSAGEQAHLYCCGPTPMLEAFEAAAAALPAEQRHVEYFSNTEAPATDGGFEVELTESALTLVVPAGNTILQTMLDAGLDVPYSCTEGICGTCETRVISGVPDHRDLVLTDQEKAANDTIMICCSGSQSPRLVLER